VRFVVKVVSGFWFVPWRLCVLSERSERARDSVLNFDLVFFVSSCLGGKKISSLGQRTRVHAVLRRK
jgi:hypothetical protein